MNPIGTHGQGCPEDENYGAVALAMQHNRDAVDATLTTDQAALDGYNRRPWLHVVSSLSVTQVQTITEWTFGTAWNGFTVLTNVLSSATITSSGVNRFTAGGFPTGWWNIGGYCSYQPTGAVTNFSRRLMCIQLSHPVQFSQVYDTIVQTSFESNTGTDSMTLNGMFYLDSAFTYLVTLGFSHRNTGSSVQVNSGARIWANYLGTGVNA